MSLRNRSALAMVLLLGLGGCQGTTAAVDPPAPAAAQAADRVECSACRVDYFNGFQSRPLTIGADGAVSVPGGGSAVVFISGPGQIPQVKTVGPDRPLGTVRLAPAQDPRGGWLALAVVTSATGGKRGAPPHTTPVARAEVAVVLGRARQLVVTNDDGIAVVPLAANHYRVFYGDFSFEVDVPQGGTAVLPVVARRLMID